MPIYQFVCKGCEYQFEKIVQKMDTPPCPQCGQETARGIEKPSPFQWGRGGGFTG